MKQYKFFQWRMDAAQETFVYSEADHFRMRVYEESDVTKLKDFLELECKHYLSGSDHFVRINIGREYYVISLFCELRGQEDNAFYNEQHIRRTQGAILYYDICSIATNFESLVSQIKEMKGRILRVHDVDNFPIIVVGIAASCNKHLIEQYNDKVDALVKAVEINSFIVILDDAREKFLTPIYNLVSQADALIKKDYAGWTALHFATYKGDSEMVKLLLDKGVSPDEKTNNGRTALQMASYNGYLDIVKLLLGKSVSLNDKDNEGQTAFRIAKR
ncbi:MAG: ankyrin repeat domain-containing protein, partial [Gammaproteobacteria bacterium]